MDRSHTLALWALHRLRSEELPDIAVNWLAADSDSPSLRQLAACASPTMSEVAPLFERALTELRIDTPTREEALMFLARLYAQQIVVGSVSPYEGARKIWWEVANEMHERSRLLTSFIGAASELEDLPERTVEDGYDRRAYARELEEMILSSARELLAAEPNQALQATAAPPTK